MRDALDLYDLPFYNNSGEAIPPYAVMQVDEWKDDANDRDYFRVKKPDGDGKTFILNGPLEVAASSDGMGTRRDGMPVRYSSGTPAVDQTWGPTSSSWNLSSSGTGFNIVGGLETIDGVTVVRVSLAGGGSGNVIYAQVVSNVTSGDPTFTFDNAVAEVGSIPAGGTGTAQNQYGQEYVDNEWVHLFQRKDNGQWLTERGGTAGTVLRFETTAAKAWDASTVAGVLLDASDAPVGGAITLTDRAPAKHEALVGSRGWCVRNGDDYWIITMDSPARWVEGTLNANWDLGDDHQAITVTGWWGAAPNHLEPETSTVDIYDNILVRSRKYFTGEKFRALWDEKLKLYVTNNTPGDFITIKGTTGSVSRSDGTFTLAEVVGVNGQVPTGTITVTNDPPINTPGGRTVYARFNYSIGTNLQTAWDTGDGGNILLHLRGLADWNGSVQQPLDHDADGDPHWHGSAPCTPPE